jgi:hypothetical protein
MRNKLILFLTSALLLSGCETVNRVKDNAFRKTADREDLKNPPARPAQLKDNERFKEYIVQSKADPKEAYERAKSFIMSAAYRPEFKHDLPAENKFMMKGFVEACRAMGGAFVYEVAFVLNFEARPGRFRVLFDNVVAAGGGQLSGRNSDNPFSALFSSRKPKTAEELELLATNCLEPIKSKLVESIESKAGKKDW